MSRQRIIVLGAGFAGLWSAVGAARALDGRGILECGAVLEPTPANLLCRDLWERCGFAAAGEGRYRRAGDPPLMTLAHIELQLDMVEQPVRTAAE